ncbi:4-(cytidine 5'-diphospho)-2-C-methyl-D-erythritol kinase [Alloacidobacterium dinghuense]|uniref:4-diphosphocytidyl-2-C-methyl-D-erythritol kinase n=1 Tax=Alloacidobacterium dinghuense TaxID=2763107 RepID=A0A7G8BEY9_9BACT|nr:4-(cytidine 5'-diphospho)-2-C-methyl-D-erythritol kinase [Alloacidobacterium dinghuense]QNI31109.1 4-(cytidine 5'-diphospho)-2-C-methyl-D-erythritol kinase [Alloacidobacterium dinghuense]
MSTRVRSFSKINLGLAIGPSRPDGFHALTTLYQTLAAHDLLTVEANKTKAGKGSITLTTNDERVPTDERNTVWKMLDRALPALKAPAEVHVHIEKRLPVQGGLGAGSANAVAALIGLEHELNQELSGGDRLKIAAEVGSDVPLFLLGGAILGVGRGEEVYPMPDLPETHCVVALPNVGVSTPQAFRDWDSRHAEGLTREDSSDRLKELSRALSACLCEPHSSGVFSLGEDRPGNPLLALVRTGIENDFEGVVFRQHPSLGDIKRILVCSDQPEQAALYAALSGSGSAVFGLYEAESAAKAAEERLSASGIASMRTKTLPREAYWRTMIEDSHTKGSVGL